MAVDGIETSWVREWSLICLTSREKPFSKTCIKSSGTIQQQNPSVNSFSLRCRYAKLSKKFRIMYSGLVVVATSTVPYGYEYCPLPKKRSKSAANHLLWKGVWREK